MARSSRQASRTEDVLRRFELASHEGSVMPVQSHELVVRTFLHDRGVIEHNDAIGVLNRAQAVGNYDPGTAQRIQVSVDQAFGQ
jgi:hypothetical protein